MATAVAIVVGLVTNLIWAGVVTFRRCGVAPSLGTLATFAKLYSTLASIRMSAFHRTRADYKTTIDGYISTANTELKIVSVTLITGEKYNGLQETLNKMLGEKTSLHVHISLLNPNKRQLIAAISDSLNTSWARLSSEIKNTLERLLAFRDGLSKDKRCRLHIYQHNVIPFCSAILIDPHEVSGRIQCETKGYKVAMAASWGFELRYGSRHSMYHTLVTSFERLIDDAERL